MSKKKRITPYIGPMESWWDYLVSNNYFTVDQIRNSNVNHLQYMEIPTKNLYNWTPRDDIRFIIVVFNNHSLEYLQQKFNCSEFCVWKTLKRIFGTMNLTEIRNWSKKRRRNLLYTYVEKDEIANIDELVKELTLQK